MLNFFHLPTFLIAFSLGLLFVYLSRPHPRVIMVYPTPINHDVILYKDDADMCFKHNPREVKCPTNPLEIQVRITCSLKEFTLTVHNFLLINKDLG